MLYFDILRDVKKKDIRRLRSVLNHMLDGGERFVYCNTVYGILDAPLIETDDAYKGWPIEVVFGALDEAKEQPDSLLYTIELLAPIERSSC